MAVISGLHFVTSYLFTGTFWAFGALAFGSGGDSWSLLVNCTVSRFCSMISILFCPYWPSKICSCASMSRSSVLLFGSVFFGERIGIVAVMFASSFSRLACKVFYLSTGKGELMVDGWSTTVMPP